jgi:hypothetical protein
MTQSELAVLQQELAEATRLAFDACRRDNPDQTLYAYALVMCHACGEALEPWCHSEEQLASKESKWPGDPKWAGQRRYCPDEWWALRSGPVRTRRGWDFEAIESRLALVHEQHREERPDIVLGLLIDALGALDREGYFGSGASREAVTLLVYVSDDALSDEWWPESVRRLNPPAVVERFRAAVS